LLVTTSKISLVLTFQAFTSLGKTPEWCLNANNTKTLQQLGHQTTFMVQQKDNDQATTAQKPASDLAHDESVLVKRYLVFGGKRELFI